MTTTSFIIRLCFAVGAFNAANQVERPVLRAVGFAYLLIAGIFGTLAAISGGSWHTWIVVPGRAGGGGVCVYLQPLKFTIFPHELQHT